MSQFLYCLIKSLTRLPANKTETGGLSGKPIKNYSLAALRILRSQLPASIPLIGCGGISTGADALEYAKAGASLVQVYTAFGYDGVGTCRRIKDELVEELRKEGLAWDDVVKKAVGELSLKDEEKVVVRVDAEGGIAQWIEEAQELKKLLDRLGERMGDDRMEGITEGGVAATQPLVS